MPFFSVFFFPVVNMDYGMEGTNIALAVFIPTAIILVVVLGIYVYFSKWVITSNFYSFHFGTNWAFTGCPSLSLLFTQTPREVDQNADVLAAVWQHDRRVSLRQPCIWERSKYRCHEHARRGFTEHQCAVLIPFPSGCHPVVISCFTSRGHHHHPSSSITAAIISKSWLMMLLMRI